MSNDPDLTDDDIEREDPSEIDDDRDAGGRHGADTGDLPTEDDDNLDRGGEGPRDVGDDA
jgi:hypothetical protein